MANMPSAITQTTRQKTAFWYVRSGSFEQVTLFFLYVVGKKCNTDIFDSLFEGNGGTCWTRTVGIEAIRERPMNTATNTGRLDCGGSEHWCVPSKQLACCMYYSARSVMQKVTVKCFKM